MAYFVAVVAIIIKALDLGAKFSPQFMQRPRWTGEGPALYSQ